MRKPSVDLATMIPGDGWTIIGKGEARGATLEDVVATANYSGPDSLQGSVRRDARRRWPDLVEDAPARLYVDGMLVWGGRVATVSGAGRHQVNVECSGWQYAMDDAVLDAAWVYADHSSWRDVRELPSAALATYRAAAFVDSSDGAILLGWPSGTVLATGTRAGVVLDLGASPTIDLGRLVAAWTRIGGAFAGGRFRAAIFDASSTADLTYYLGSGSLDQTTLATIGGTQTWDVDLNATASATSTGTAGPLAGRYAIMYVEYTGAGVTLAADAGVAISQATAYQGSGTDYYSAGTTLVASTVVADVLARCAGFLHPDRRRLASTAFVLPHFATEGIRTAREIIDAALMYDGARFGVDAYLRPVLYADATAPTISVGSDADWEDAAIASAGDVASAVVVEAEGPTGAAIRAWRSAGVATASPRGLRDTGYPTNGGFESGTTGWLAVTGSIATTATADTGSLALNLTGTAGGDAETKTSSAIPVVAGRSYRVALRMRRQAGSTAGVVYVSVSHDANPSSGAAARRSLRQHELNLTSLTAGAYVTTTFDFVAPQTGTVTIAVGYRGGLPISSALLAIDGVDLLEMVDTPADRFSASRARVVDLGVATTWTGLRKLGDSYAIAKRRAPMRGRVVVYGDGAYAIQESRRVRAHELLLRWGEAVALRGTRDPWTGGLGRWGTIANVEWTSDGVATIDVDSESGGFDALLNRVGALTGRVT